MNQKAKQIVQRYASPAYWAYRKLISAYGRRRPMTLADFVYRRTFGRRINWNNPQDLNEKINWLKFHADQREWARLADKLAVREYVKERGLGDILIPLLGQWDTAEEVLAAWDSLPDEFALKSNNGCGHVLIVSAENGGKKAVNRKALQKTLRSWLAERDYGLNKAEIHYQFIQNRIIAEALLKDDAVNDFSRSMVDYKIWCFHGRPCGCLVVYDRDIGTKSYSLDYYDLNWNERTDFMSDASPRHALPKPENWERMLEIAAILSEGRPQVRVDLYNIHGKIRFGELTFTSAGGYMKYFTPKALMEMGQRIELDLNAPWNEFAEKRFRK